MPEMLWDSNIENPDFSWHQHWHQVAPGVQEAHLESSKSSRWNLRSEGNDKFLSIDTIDGRNPKQPTWDGGKTL